MIILDAEKWAKGHGKIDEGSPISDIRLIDTLMRFGYIDEAKKQGHDRDPSGWMMDWCTAREQHDMQHPQAALESLHRVIQKFRSEPDLGRLLPVTWKNVMYLYGEIKEKEGDYETALAAYLELLRSFLDDPETSEKAIHCMKRQGKFTDIIELLESRTKEVSKDAGTTLRRLFLSLARSAEFHHDITFAARQKGRLDFIKDGYADAVGAAESGSETLSYLRYYYGLALWYQKDRAREDAEKAIHIWEINAFDGEYSRPSHIQRITSFKLSSIYLQKAQEYGFGTSAGWFYVKKLEDLVKRKSTEFQWTGSEEVLLARAYHLAGFRTRAAKLAARHVGPALDILSDKDPENDWEGYTSLSNTLGHMDDDDDALAAKSLIGPLQRDWSRSDSADTLAEIAYLRGRLKSSCDNLCGTEWKYATDMHICRDCIRTIFCGRCLKQLKEGEMEYRLCDKNHRFLEVRKFERAPENYVRVGEKVKTIEEWKKEIKSRYEV